MSSLGRQAVDRSSNYKESCFFSERQEQDGRQADRGVLCPCGRGQDQEARHEVSAGIFCPKWSGETPTNWFQLVRCSILMQGFSVDNTKPSLGPNN